MDLSKVDFSTVGVDELEHIYAQPSRRAPDSIAKKVGEAALFALQYFVGILIEILAIACCAILYPFSATWFDPKKLQNDGDNNNKDIPIILVHGYLHNSTGMLIQKKLFEKNGYRNVFTIDLGAWPVNKRIEDYATLLQKKVNEIVNMPGMNSEKRVNLVGHSMGGLVCAYYAQHLASADKVVVGKIATMLSPLRGTKMSIFGFGKCARQMSHKNKFVNHLSYEIRYLPKAEYLHFGSKTDFIVSQKSAFNDDPLVKQQSSVDKGQETGKNYPWGHCAILFSPGVNKEIRNFFEQQENFSDIEV